MVNGSVIPATAAPAGYPVVGVAVSVEAHEQCAELLANLPPNCGVALVLVQPLRASRANGLTGLAQRVSALPVLKAREGLGIQPNTVYVIPPYEEFTITGAVFHAPSHAELKLAHPIDNLFRSLAEECGSHAIGVVFTDIAFDGALGLQAIQAKGGVTFAARLSDGNGMPQRPSISAIDSVRSPADLAAELLWLCRHPYLALEQGPEFPAEEMAGLRAVVAQLAGIDLRVYNPGYAQRRIGRRMAACRVETLTEYGERLRTDVAEVEALLESLWLHPVGFFRDPAALEHLKSKFYPAFFKGRDPALAVRVWIPECSQGEEVYSVAITLLEYMQDHRIQHPVQIFGTDLSEPALEVSRAGVYSKSVASTMPPDRLARFFLRKYDGYSITHHVRELCLFSKHNLAEDAPFSRLDLIVCRNVLSRLAPAAQRRALQGFYYALRPHGVLLVGTSEEAAGMELFFKAKGQHKIYLKQKPTPPVTSRPSDLPAPPENRDGDAALELRVTRTLVRRYGSSFILVDHELRMIPVEGALSEPNLPHVAGGSLSAELHKLIQKARRRGATVRGEVLRLADKGSSQHIRLTVVPLDFSGREYYLVEFEEAEAGWENQKLVKGLGGADYTRTLEENLASVVAELQKTLEEQQGAVEEMKAVNEEMAASNEELRATESELVSASKGLEASNRELAALNEELKARNRQLGQANRDLYSLLRNLSVPMLIVGTDLRIQRFTPQVECLLEVAPADIGRPVGDLRTKFEVGNLEQAFQQAVDELRTHQRVVRDGGNRWYWMTIKPYRLEDNVIEGAILTLQ